MRVATSVALATLLFGCGGGNGTGGGDDVTDPDGGQTADAPPFASGTGPYFNVPMFWNRDVSASPKATYSDATIAALRAAGGWGNGDTFQIDFSIDVLNAPAGT